MSKIILGVTGSIAAYKSYEISRELQRRNHKVVVITTENALNFVQPISYLTQHMGYDLFENQYQHVHLTEFIDLICIAPCSANFIAKLACGMCDDMLSATCLGAKGPIHIFPAMNVNMLENTATQVNISTLTNRGMVVHNTRIGEHACGSAGAGCLMEPHAIIENIEYALLKGGM